MSTPGSEKSPHKRRPKGEHAALRRCLGGCGRRFDSEGPWNRICPDCAEKQTALPRRMLTGAVKASVHFDLREVVGESEL
jgi:hypothetical protein